MFNKNPPDSSKCVIDDCLTSGETLLKQEALEKRVKFKLPFTVFCEQPKPNSFALSPLG